MSREISPNISPFELMPDEIRLGIQPLGVHWWVGFGFST
jgi:hypothetical protein